MNSTREAWEAKAVLVLTPHLGHVAVLQGWHEMVITEHRLTPETITMTFAGFVADCKTCGISLSQQWND